LIEETTMNFTIEYEREDDGRWIAEIVELPGAMAYGSTHDEATAKVQVLALRILAEQLEANEVPPSSISILIPAPV
jgi:predicted RNase H-like HicB family nuclease